MKKFLITTLFLGFLGCSNEPEIKLPAVEMVNIADDQAIVTLYAEPYKVLNGTDSNDKPSKIYKVDEFNQIDISDDFLIVGWKQHDKGSMERVVKVAMGVLGSDGGYFVHEVDRQGKVDQRSIQGHTVTNAFCVADRCMIKIYRSK